MNRTTFALTITMTIFVAAMLASGRGAETTGVGADRGAMPSGLNHAAPARTQSPATHGADHAATDALTQISNPSVQRSPLSVRAEQPIRARGTALALEIDPQLFERIRFEHDLQLDEFPMPAARRGEETRTATLHLERIPVITDETVFVLGDPHAPDGIGQELPVPQIAMFRGTVDGEPDSRVFLSLTADTAYGYIRSGEQTHLISPGPHGEERDLLIYNLTAMPAGAVPWRDFVCSAPQKFIDLHEPGVEEAIAAAQEDPPCRRVKLAIETDMEFTDELFDGDKTAAGVYAATLVGAASEVYIDQINSFFELTFVRLWTGEDIWTANSTVMQLLQFRDVWNSQMGHVDRHLAHYLSGRGLGGGVAWLNAVCDDTFGYGLSANLNGFFPYPLEDNNAQNWDVMVFTHELGHNFNAPHTHDVCPEPLDECAPPNWQGSCQDETNCITNGTIMSYCHLCPGGLANVVLEFHPTIRGIMLDFLDTVDGGPGCDLNVGTTTCEIDEECEWITLGEGTNNTVWSLAEFEGDLIAGGDFTAADGQTAQRIARWDGDTWNAIGAANNTVRSLVEFNDELVAGGLFTVIGGIGVNRVAKWNGSTWTALGSGVSGGSIPRVFDMLVIEDDLYVAGTFLNAGGETVNRIARWDGMSWHALGTGMNNNVYALVEHDGDLYAAGSFTTAGGVTANRIARWDGSNWHPVGGGLNNIAFALTVYEDQLVAGGQFTQAGGEPANYVTRWDGSAWHPLEDGVNDTVQSLAVLEERLYVGGSFAVAGSVITSRLAQWDGEAWQAAAISVNNIVRAMTPYENALAVGGSFTFVNGQPINRVALVECIECRFADLNCDGTVDGADLLILLSAWGPCPDPDDCPADLNGDGAVDGGDLLLLLSEWG